VITPQAIHDTACNLRSQLEAIAGEELTAVSLHANQGCPVYLVLHAAKDQSVIILDFDKISEIRQRFIARRAETNLIAFPNSSH